MTSDDFSFTKKMGAKKLRKIEEKERKREAREVVTINKSIYLYGQLDSLLIARGGGT
jgi:hypothetical protein